MIIGVVKIHYKYVVVKTQSDIYNILTMWYYKLPGKHINMKKLRPHERGNMTKIIKKIVCFMLTVAMVLSALSTDLFEKTIYGSDFSCIVLSRYTEKMDVYEQFYLIAITSTGKKPTFSSSKSSIASVDKYGLITAKKEGKTTITVKSGKARAYCIITVNKTIITLSKTKISLHYTKYTFCLM